MQSSRPSMLLTPFLSRLGWALFCICGLSACNRDNISVYIVPKESTTSASRELPPDWKEVPAGQMLLSKYVVSDASGAQAEVTVSAFPGDVGGVLRNVNRWREQLQLEPVSAEKLPDLTASLDVGGGTATLVDMSGQDAKTSQKTRMIAAIVPQGNRT